MNNPSYLNIAGWAVVIWGAFASFLLFCYAVVAVAPVATVFSVLVAGVTYLFQAIYFAVIAADREPVWWLTFLSLVPVGLWAAGLLLAFNGV